MDKKIKLLAACSVAALTTVACAPNTGSYAPYPQTQGPVYSGSTATPVTHSHSGKVHSHKLPATGIRHTHSVGNSNTQIRAQIQNQVPTGNYNGGITHSHSGRTHSHKLPASGLNHTHRIGANASVIQNQQTTKTNHTPPVSGTNNRRCWHGRNTKGQCNPAPQQNTYRPPVNTTYQPPATNNQTTTRHCWHGRNTNGQCNPAPQTQNGGRTPPPTRNVNNNNTGNYYDNYPGSNNTTNSTYTPPAPTDNNGNYYDYTGQGSSSTYYDTVRPKGSTHYPNYQPQPKPNLNYQPQPKPNTGSFAPESYSGDVYTVKRGDTVFQVMRNTGVYWKDIIRLNNLQAPNYQINPGQRLRLR